MSRTQEQFERDWLNPYPPQTLLSWLEEFADQLDCPPPEPHIYRNPPESFDEYFKRAGAWETQMTILKKLRYAIKMEKSKSK